MDSGLLTCVVTNAFASDSKRFETSLEYVDQLAISFDSGSAETRKKIGRTLRGSLPLQNSKYFRAFELAKEYGISTKLNTVVSAHNWNEDLSYYVESMKPDRWKVFQVLPVSGQNDEFIDTIRVTDVQFKQFCDRHIDLRPIVESNEMMTASYVMIDPWGRFFDNSKGRHTYSRPIYEVGLIEALSDVSFDISKYIQRGGSYQLPRIATANSSCQM